MMCTRLLVPLVSYQQAIEWSGAGSNVTKFTLNISSAVVSHSILFLNLLVFLDFTTLRFSPVGNRTRVSCLKAAHWKHQPILALMWLQWRYRLCVWAHMHLITFFMDMEFIFWSDIIPHTSLLLDFNPKSESYKDQVITFSSCILRNTLMECDCPECDCPDQFLPIFKRSSNPTVERYVIPAIFEIASSFHYLKSIFS